ncbi:deoxynucleoside kinase [Pseudohongiella sp. SYSU M77423]|uniref:deoxynucleoside kinase n=1 Tax=unclassified Pseudohongiella TaxID=2629611 RepID=UPI000C97FB7F|nr:MULTISPECIES: deoxynucleoside kinase [unclassified Pseudohongiella]MAO41729.1 deoxynucleoside kinase [Pseudohongiella sp.]MDH7944637.1 deoxynucleoside kinase [Pseudohongiella sp. SYSU M77423]HBX36969.1 deoxynucleoside kinase [Pseudohongiella sp.]|tara:strand:- start:87529 stop:88176 length:648 start_codon:yes stop_codon:yes gene_type:complete
MYYLPRYIAVEGPIGVGKTSLAKRLAESFNYDIVLEKPEDNPFLERFYRNPKQHALATQLFFLFQRSQQLQGLKQNDLFEPVRVADFLIEKDMLFAQQNLDPDEFQLYQTVYQHLTIDAPVPDLVIYLQAPTPVLLARIQKRGIAAEQAIEADYLERLNNAYTTFFHYYDRSPLLIVNCSDLDLVGRDDDYEQLVNQIKSGLRGVHYFNPKPTLL